MIPKVCSSCIGPVRSFNDSLGELKTVITRPGTDDEKRIGLGRKIDSLRDFLDQIGNVVMRRADFLENR